MDLFGNLQEKQKQVESELRDLEIKKSSSDNAVSIVMNGKMEIKDISIDFNKIDLADSDQLEDYLILCLNQAIEEARAKETELSQQTLSDLLPGGMGGLKGMMGS